MLRILQIGCVSFAACFLTMLPQFDPAFAGQWGGGGTGGGSCTESGDITTCQASVPGSAAGTGGSPDAISTGEATSSGSTGSPSTCQYAPMANGGPPPLGAGPNGQWYAIVSRGSGTCQGLSSGSAGPLANVWVPTGSAPPPPPPDPATVGAQAASLLTPAVPSISLSPVANAWVNFPEWLWIDSSIWHSVSTSATACNAGGCTTSDATATPFQVVWTFGDGGSSVCNSPGTIYNQAITADQVTNCSYVFKTTSASYSVTATVDWSVSWAGPDGSGGSLPVMTTAAKSSIEVKQIESVLTNPGQ